MQKLVENGYKIDTKCSQTLQNRDDFVNQIFAQKIKANLDISSHILMEKNSKTNWFAMVKDNAFPVTF